MFNQYFNITGDNIRQVGDSDEFNLPQFSSQQQQRR